MDARELIGQDELALHEEIGAFLDGELSEAEATAFRRRAVADPALARAIDEMRSVGTLLDLYDVPESLGRGVAEEVLTAVRPAGVLHRLRAPLAAAAVVLLSLGVTLSMFGGDAPPAPAVNGATAQATTAMTIDEQKVIAGLHWLNAHDLRELGLDAADAAFLRVAREEATTER